MLEASVLSVPWGSEPIDIIAFGSKSQAIPARSGLGFRAYGLGLGHVFEGRK